MESARPIYAAETWTPLHGSGRLPRQNGTAWQYLRWALISQPLSILDEECSTRAAHMAHYIANHTHFSHTHTHTWHSFHSFLLSFCRSHFPSLLLSRLHPPLASSPNFRFCHTCPPCESLTIVPRRGARQGKPAILPIPWHHIGNQDRGREGWQRNSLRSNVSVDDFSLRLSRARSVAVP